MNFISKISSLKPKFSKNDKQVINSISNNLEPQPNFRGADGTTNRNEQIITWRLPNGCAVQMYINPQSLVVKDSKKIDVTRTKGGFVVQYWGANLTEISLSGHTGSSGIQGINILYDIYNSENRGFDLVAETQAGELTSGLSSQGLDASNAGSFLSSVASDIASRNFILRPSLASLATSVLMFYQGIEYKGFFTSFQVTESAERTGIFEYSISFTATEKRGRRGNVFAWQKEPTATDTAGQLINGIGNAVRGFFGLSNQLPEFYHPESAPHTFGKPGEDLSAALGLGDLSKGKLF